MSNQSGSNRARQTKPPPPKTAKYVNPARIVIPYDERIAAIMKFFSISRPAAGFIYHRKRRGYPFKNPTDEKFLEWNLKLQTALVKADECIGWDWEEIHFGKEEQALSQHGIHIDQQSDSDTHKNESKSSETPDDGWTVVKSEKREKYRYTKTLQLMGFIQRYRRPKGVREGKKASPALDEDSDSDTDGPQISIDDPIRYPTIICR